MEYTIEDSAEDYYVTEVDRVSGKEIVAFFASVKYNQKRNDLLKPAVGRYQSLVWKHPNSLKGTQFALNFVLKFLLESLPNSTLVTTDMRQSKSGRDLWARIVSYAAKSNRYDCYYGLAVKDNKTLITVTGTAKPSESKICVIPNFLPITPNVMCLFLSDINTHGS